MRTLVALSALAMAVSSGSAFADNHMGEKLDKAACEALWKKADSGNAGKISSKDAEAYISDVKAVNADGDQTVEMTEFTKACENGMIKKSASATPDKASDAGGVEPPAASSTSDRTPGKDTPTPDEQVDSSDGETSDRTPAN